MSRRPVGSIQWRRPGVARVELQAGFDPVTGKPRRMSKTVYGNDGDAERALARMLIDIGRLPSGGGLTVREYLEDIYKPALATRVRKSTRRGYERKLDDHVIPILGSHALANLEPYILDRWRDDLVGKMSGRSALHVYRAFATALNRAVKWRLIQSNPLDAVDAPRAKIRDLDTLTAKDAVKVLEAFQGHRVEPVVIVALATGLRPCELYALTWQDIDIQDGTVTVRRGLHEAKGEVYFEEPKSDRSHRTVTLPAWAVEALRPLRGIGPLVPGPHIAGHEKPSAIARDYRRHALAHAPRYVPLRDLRHTHATLMLEAGVDIVRVSRRLGHSTVAITDAHYLRPKRSADQDAADAFDRMWAGSGEKAGQAGRGVTSVAGDE